MTDLSDQLSIMFDWTSYKTNIQEYSLGSIPMGAARKYPHGRSQEVSPGVQPGFERDGGQEFCLFVCVNLSCALLRRFGGMLFS